MTKEEMFDAVVQGAKDGNTAIYFSDLNNVMCFDNNAFVDNSVGKKLKEITKHGKEWHAHEMEVAKTKKTKVFTEGVTIDGVEKEIHSVRFPVYDKNGNHCGFGGISTLI